MNKKGFTLAEVIICLVVVGLIAAVIMSNLKLGDYKEKSYIGMARKIMANFQAASQQIREQEQTSVPTRSFIVNSLGAWEYVILNSTGSANATVNDVVNLYGKYIKYEKSIINFCDNSGYCSDTSIKGAKLPNGAYIGFKTSGTIIDCPAYRIPSETSNTAGKGKCWGTFYIDADGNNGPNAIGRDVYVFGLDENGLVY
ncbi:MAG: prepilin-type N-terminal cleavage/methylation domain-containing protein [Candidatus Gastranaerophilales bacterium]|nr:prepilin-type N-terminal cleavage/methylation domain-containing protein [Candidatus Gastranaerophilales bacterium]